MLPSLPILVFGTLFMLWSRTSLAPAKQAAPKDDNSGHEIVFKIVRSDESA